MLKKGDKEIVQGGQTLVWPGWTKINLRYSIWSPEPRQEESMSTESDVIPKHKKRINNEIESSKTIEKSMKQKAFFFFTFPWKDQ